MAKYLVKKTLFDGDSFCWFAGLRRGLVGSLKDGFQLIEIVFESGQATFGHAVSRFVKLTASCSGRVSESM